VWKVKVYKDGSKQIDERHKDGGKQASERYKDGSKQASERQTCTQTIVANKHTGEKIIFERKSIFCNN
jgi:hypothetical protein